MKDHYGRDVKIGVGLIVASYLAALGALYAIAGNLDTSVAKILQDRTKTQAQLQEINLIAELKNESAVAEGYRAAMDKLLPNQDRLLDFPRWIDSLARNHGVGARFSFQGDAVSAQGTSPAYIAFSLDLTGTIPNLGSLLRELESAQEAQFLVGVDSFNIARSGDSYRLGLQGKVFSK